MSKHILFHTGALTLGDIVMVQRLACDDHDMAALVALLVSRSDASEETIMALPLTELEPLIQRMTEAVQTAGVMDTLARAWSAHDDQPS